MSLKVAKIRVNAWFPFGLEGSQEFTMDVGGALKTLVKMQTSFKKHSFKSIKPRH